MNWERIGEQGEAAVDKKWGGNGINSVLVYKVLKMLK